MLDELLVLTYREPDAGIETAWADEVKDRIAAHERGELKAHPADEVLKKYLKS